MTIWQDSYICYCKQIIVTTFLLLVLVEKTKEGDLKTKKMKMISTEFTFTKTYILYFLSALLNSWMILFYLGFSSGLTNYLPLIALFGGVLLFIIALPILVYNIRIGIIVGLISLFLILPYSILSSFYLFLDWKFSWGLLFFTIPLLIILLSLYISIKYLLNKDSVQALNPISSTTKIILALLPILLFILYVIKYGRYWNLENLFNIPR